MKILILSASIGSGHMQAAEAIAEQFVIRNSEFGMRNDESEDDDIVEIVDFMDRGTSTLNWILKRLYLSILGLVPDLYDRIYRLAGVRQFGSITRLIWSTLMYIPFSNLLNKCNPDVIICTHPFPEAAAALWKFLHPNSNKRFTLAAVLTDYSLHEIWIYGGVDLYFVATDEMKAQLEKHGNYKVFVTGIPIRSQFNYELGIRNEELESDKSSLDSAFRIMHSALIMGGGLGLGAFEETILALNEVDFNLKIFVVTGNNQGLKSKLESLKSRHELHILGFVDNISELMQQADLLISKPGGLTLSEAFAVGLPILLLPPIPGPESLNAQFAVNNGAALALSKPSDITEALSNILSKKDLLQTMRKSAKGLARSNAAADIVSLIRN